MLDLDEFTLNPVSPMTSGGQSKTPIPDGPEVIDRTQDGSIQEEESLEIKPEASKKEEEKVEERTKDSKETKKVEVEENKEEEPSGEVAEEEETGEVDLLPFAKELYDGFGFETEFDGKEFEETFGGKGVESLIKFAKTVIEENSKIQHANEEAEKYYNYVANGGDPKKLSYLLDTQASYDNMEADDLNEDENLQVGVLRSYLKETNPKKDDKWIDAKIERYKSSGTLEDESKDALEDLKSISKERTESLLKAEENRVKEEKKKVEKYWEDIQMLINSEESFAGVKLSNAGKDKFYNYLRGDAYQKDMQDKKKALEAAFVIYQGGLQKTVERVGGTKATNKLESTLSRWQSKGTNVKSQTIPLKSTNSENQKGFDPNEWSL